MCIRDSLTFEYIRRDEEGNVEGITTAVDHVNMDIQPGEFIAILGHNGSGKSTFAKHINALLFPTEGTILVDGLDTSDEDNVMDVRQRAGMVFQNPDNQIICTLVEEEVGFGPENIGVPTEEIWERVAAVSYTHLEQILRTTQNSDRRQRLIWIRVSWYRTNWLLI